MTVEEAFQVCEDAAYLGTEEDQKKHEEALRVIKDNLENNFLSTDLIKEYYENDRDQGICADVKLTYEDYLTIAQDAAYAISHSVILSSIQNIIAECTYQLVDAKEAGDKND